MDAPPQRVVGVVDAEGAVFKAHQTVEQVPAHLAVLAVVPAADLVAALVVFVVRARVFAQQVVHQCVAFRVLIQRAADFSHAVVQQVAGRVEGEGFDAQAAGGAEQSTHRVVAVGQRPAAAVVDVGQLARGVVFVLAFEQCGLVVATAQQLGLQTADRVPLLGLQQAVALVAGDFAVQVVALVADEFVFVEAHA
ncbi:hypothetical protein AP059_00001 [Pseudomonas sp. TAA207]|nr:hypothetical protein AP059_00001 [Pseudomonas sp. TAA207]